ncbi:oligosaccharide repeat unit polymerase [Paraburkholderia sp. B3]|uniref:oligosaccharide repeat unit polymerase n=1 Tax=Paraburkholderia sp. B3 TaxID=3134791 RepID=UPI003981D9CF
MKTSDLDDARRAPKGEANIFRRANPFAIFVAAYAGYNVLGLVDAPWIIKGTYDKTLCWELFAIGMAGLFIGYFSAPRLKIRQPVALKKFRKSKQLTILFFLIFAFCISAAIVLNHGLPLLQGEARFQNSALLSNLAPLYGFWILTRMISDLERKKRPGIFQPIVYIVGILILGYRSPVLAFVLTYYCYWVVFRLSGSRAIWLSVFVGGALGLFAACLSLFRISQNYDVARFFENVDFNFVLAHKYILPLVPALSMFDFSQSTIAKIGIALKEPMYGGLMMSNFETLLPGKHWGARNVIGDLTGARWVAGRPMSITPTLQGALYTDFGYVGVFVGLFLIAWFIRWYRNYAFSHGVDSRFCFCYFFSLSLMSIHAGYWDVNFIFVGFFVVLIKIFDAMKNNLGGQG